MCGHNEKACCTPNRRLSMPAKSHEYMTTDIRPSESTPDDMVKLGGEFLMGTDDPIGFSSDGEGPVRRVSLKPFYIDFAAVTNTQFARFVYETGYETDAELFGWSFVFHQFVSRNIAKSVTQIVESTPWWWRVDGASWKHPEGRDSSIADRMDHPVIHVSWRDSSIYGQWIGKRLPTEAEWEFAARGGLEQKRYPWGDELTPGGEHQCNIWQGDFPDYNNVEDGYTGTAPTRAFSPNGHGLFNTAGNVWEWCSDWFSAHSHIKGPHIDPNGPSTGTTKVMKGGSYLCHASYCNRYRVAARSSATLDSSTGHMSFRCARDAV